MNNKLILNVKKLKINLMFFSLTLGLFVSCERPVTVFSTQYFNDYSIDIPNNYHQEGSGKYLFTENNRIEYLIFFKTLPDTMSLKAALSILLKMNTSKDPQLNFMEFQQQKELTINNNQYLISFYKMNNNKNPLGYAVMSYYVFGVIKMKGNILLIQTYSLLGNNQADMEKSILSIKLRNSSDNL